ncbi:hypothetical protein B6I21_09510, partial [candidate division KSB1 bacterium 4572_119]
RKLAKKKCAQNRDTWPINYSAGTKPTNWTGWPGGKKFALLLTHDVETSVGHKKCIDLLKIEKKLGFYSSFNFVPERYEVSSACRKDLIEQGYEVGVHGLKHDGKLYKSRKIFNSRAIKINHYLEDWQAVGFRSPAMHHNLEWLLDLNLNYDASTFDTDPFEPQSDGVNTIFPFEVKDSVSDKSYIELPYTLVQDFTLFISLQEKSINIWKIKLDWIVKNGGMALLNTHPDYMNFDKKKTRIDEYPVQLYIDFLNYVKSNYKDQYWNVLPKQLAEFWQAR